MWKQVLLFVAGLYCFQTGFAISQDESVRSYLANFNSTRNNHVNPAIKTKARDYIVKTFQDFGLDTWTEEFPSNQQNFSGINIIGRVNGKYTGTSEDKILIIASHYDTVATTQGVDDSGSGITALLQALRQYKSSSMKCTQNYTLLFVAFDLEENQKTCQAPPCSCSRGLCGSAYFVANLTRYLASTKGTLRGAYIMDTILNYNTTPHSQHFPVLLKPFFGKEYQWLTGREFRGDWLAVIGRKSEDSELSRHFVENFKQGVFAALPFPLSISGRPKDITDPRIRTVMSNFLRSDHRSFWNSNDSWPAIFLTDTANFRGYMIKCYHEQCDNMNQVTPEMIAFMGKTADALVLAAHSLTQRVCPTRRNCKNIAIDGDTPTRISSPYYPSQYPNGIECSWYRESKYKQTFQFEDFDLERSDNCTNDFLEVLAGNTIDQTNRVIGRYCGSTKPSVIRVSDKVVRVRFVSDALVSRKGFKMSWKTDVVSDASALGISRLSTLLVVLSIVFCI